MTIKHLVISGGGPSIIQSLGVIQRLEEAKFIEMSNIQTIYGTSSGAILGVLLCLFFDWETINDYLIKRPWHELFKIKVENIFEAYKSKGIFDEKIIEKCFKPLFDAKDISLDITLADFYKLSNIELHMFSFEINNYKICDISYLTHPDLKVLKAIHMSSALPVLVVPVCIEDKCYIDGGLMSNYPLNSCIESGKISEEILGIKNYFEKNEEQITYGSTMFDFLLNFLFKTISNLSTSHLQTSIKNEIMCDVSILNISNFNIVAKSIDKRRELLQNGIECANKFLSYKECCLENSI
jgi:predicted acylesterase/phospholipase RssA